MNKGIIETVLWTAITCMLFACIFACNKTDLNDEHGNGTEKGSAPKSLIGHNVTFYYKYEGKLYRSLSLNVSNDNIFLALSYTSKKMLGGDEFIYNQLNENSAKLDMVLNYISAIGNEAFTVHDYRLDMTFMPDNQGYAEGKHIYEILYNGLQTKVFKKLQWYFSIDSEKLPDFKKIDSILGITDNPDGSDNPDNPDNPGNPDKPDNPSECHSEELYIVPSYVSETHFGYRIAYSFPDKYFDESKYITAGICYSTNSEPKITDFSESQNRISPGNTNSYRAISNTLSKGTVYYARPYTIESGKVTYYRTISFETVGKNIKLDVKKINDSKIEAHYEINASGTYKVKLISWNISGIYTAKDFGYLKAGDRAYYSYELLLEWNINQYFYLVATNITTDISFKSNEQYK